MEIFTGHQKEKVLFYNKSISVHKEKPVYKVVGINTSASPPELIQRFIPIFEKHHHMRHLGANALRIPRPSYPIGGK